MRTPVQPGRADVGHPPSGTPLTSCRVALDWLNFLLADAKGGLGPYLGIFLLTEPHWNQATIGLVMTASGLIGLATRAPIGGFIDATRFKRSAIVAAAAVLGVSALAITLAPVFPVVLMAYAMIAEAGAVFGPAVAAITLGVLGRQGLAAWLGRNAAFDHAGNVFIACLAGITGWWFGQQAVFYLVPIFAGFAAMAVLSIPAGAIDHARARGLDGDRCERQPAGWRALLECQPLAIFAGCVALFHFANAPMLHLVGQKLALANRGAETMHMSACIVAAQLVMVPMALLVGAKADAWGRRPIFLAAFLILPIRASSTRFPTIAIGSSVCSFWTASGRGSRGRSRPSCSLT